MKQERSSQELRDYLRIYRFLCAKILRTFFWHEKNRKTAQKRRMENDVDFVMLRSSLLENNQ